MKIRIVTAIIRAVVLWLWRNHEKIFRETMKEIGHHAHKNPPRTGKGSRRKADDKTSIPYPQEEGEYPNQVQP